MSDQKTVLKCNFINRRTGAVISEVPIVNRLGLNIDLSQFADTFDFDIKFKFTDNVDLRSHDFVEFYFDLNGQPWQVGCGFIEDLVGDTGPDTLKFQANGRCFLGQYFNFPFLKATPQDLTTITSFCRKVVNQDITIGGDASGTYLREYQQFRGKKPTVLDLGAYKGGLNVPELTDCKIAPIMQNLAEEVNNVIYQNRFGQLVIWGRTVTNPLDNVSARNTGLTLSDTRDTNVNGFQLRQSYSKVISYCEIFMVSGERNYDHLPKGSGVVENTEPRAAQIFQPEIRIFNTGTLATTEGQVSADQKRLMLAGSIVRKSNQNLYRVVIKTNQPYHISDSGIKTPYEANTLFRIKSERHKLDETMRLSGIGYSQDANGLTVELNFIPKDSLV